MSRLIRDRINQALANELLFGKLTNGGSVRVSAKQDELVFKIEPPIKQ